MTSISSKEFTDENDNIRAIGFAMSKKQYKKIFLYLDDFFNKNNSVTAADIQKKYYILEYSRAFQLVQSFVVLNLMKKIKMQGRKRRIFVQINPHFWDETKKNLIKKEEKKDGSKRTG